MGNGPHDPFRRRALGACRPARGRAGPCRPRCAGARRHVAGATITAANFRLPATAAPPHRRSRITRDRHTRRHGRARRGAAAGARAARGERWASRPSSRLLDQQPNGRSARRRASTSPRPAGRGGAGEAVGRALNGPRTPGQAPALPGQPRRPARTPRRDLPPAPEGPHEPPAGRSRTGPAPRQGPGLAASAGAAAIVEVCSSPPGRREVGQRFASSATNVRNASATGRRSTKK
jgi:hypothetical protein